MLQLTTIPLINYEELCTIFGTGSLQLQFRTLDSYLTTRTLPILPVIYNRIPLITRLTTCQYLCCWMKMSWTRTSFTQCFLNGPSPASFCFFQSFQTNNTIFQQINVKMSIQYKALGFEPTTSQHESSPITTRPGLPP